MTCEAPKLHPFPPELESKEIADLLMLLEREQQLSAWLEETRTTIDTIILADDLHKKGIV